MKKKGKRAANSSAQPKGFDFGTPAAYVSIPNVEWADQLTKSDVVGCAYGWSPAPTVRALMPSISLVVRNGELAKKAFNELATWTEKSDDDAVELTAIFLKSGGYLLGLSPEPERRAAKAVLPAILDPLMVVEAWVKTLDTTSQPVRDLVARFN